MIIELKGLPKISLNAWYSGNHWTKRKAIKDKYIKEVQNQFKDVLSKANQYEVEYVFQFKKNVLDASNCIAMLKMIEDIIFEDDKHDVIRKISIRSVKGIEDKIIIEINIL